MFGKSKDNQPETKAETQTSSLTDLVQSQRENMKELESEITPEVVKTVEKISNIITPYFIALLGLYLSDKNFLIGIILITVALISLLKISPEKIKIWIEDLKKLLSL
jgi:hypothetical protein